MPLREYWIAGVRSKRTRDGRTIFDVFARRAPEEPWSELFTTSEALLASLCQRAHEQARSVLIASRETRYGLEIVEVCMTPQEWLLKAAKDVAQLLEDRAQGRMPRGQYDDLAVGRNLTAAIAAVEAEQRAAELVERR